MKKAFLNVEKSEKKVNPYCTKFYICGFLLLCISASGGAAVMPFVDMVLLSTNTAAGILMSTLISIKFLKEKFICKYDLPSFILIVTGCTTIVVLSNKEETKYPPDRIMTLLKSTQYQAFGIFFLLLSIASFIICKLVLRGVANFNIKAENWMAALVKSKQQSAPHYDATVKEPF